MPSAVSRTFGDQFLAGGQHLALHRILAAYRSFPDDPVADRWQISHSLGTLPRPPDDGVRTWWRLPWKEVTVYVSLAPPETRRLPPDPPCRISDLPLSKPDIDLKELLRDALGKAGSLMPLSSRMKDVVTAAENTLSPPKGAAKARFLAAANAAREGDHEKYQAAKEEIHKRCLLGFEMALVDFSSAQLLLQLQAMLGQWLVEDWFDSPKDFLRSFVREVSARADERSKLIDAGRLIATTEYDWAQHALARSLKCNTLAEMTDLLYVASQRFWSVSALLDSFAHADLAGHVELNPHVVEEHWVCADTGLLSAISLLATRPADFARRLWTDASERQFDVSQFVREFFSSPIFPVVTRRFADVLAAHARSSCDDPAGIKAGAEELMRLRDGFFRMPGGEDRQFEIEWIEHALLDAHRRLGDEANASAWASGIAGRMMVWIHQRDPPPIARPGVR